LRHGLFSVEHVVVRLKDVVPGVDQEPPVLREGNLAPASPIGPQRRQVLVGNRPVAGECVDGIAVRTLELVHACHEVLRVQDPLPKQTVARVFQVLVIAFVVRHWQQIDQATRVGEVVVQ
jgi:hypothetical protein